MCISYKPITNTVIRNLWVSLEHALRNYWSDGIDPFGAAQEAQIEGSPPACEKCAAKPASLQIQNIRIYW